MISFNQKSLHTTNGTMDCAPIYPTHYHKQTVGPYTKMHIIMTNGIVVETMFKHQCHRNCQNNDLRRELALSRYVGQQQ